MKLVFAIVQDEDGKKVMDELNQAGHSVTMLSTTGGFLRSGNTTLMLGVENDKVEEVIQIIEKKSKNRKQMVNSSMPPNGLGGAYFSYPLEVEVGGATIFVTDVERFEKV